MGRSSFRPSRDMTSLSETSFQWICLRKLATVPLKTRRVPSVRTTQSVFSLCPLLSSRAFPSLNSFLLSIGSDMTCLISGMYEASLWALNLCWVSFCLLLQSLVHLVSFSEILFSIAAAVYLDSFRGFSPRSWQKLGLFPMCRPRISPWRLCPSRRRRSQLRWCRRSLPSCRWWCTGLPAPRWRSA